MVASMRVVVPKYPSIVFGVQQKIDVGQIVSSDVTVCSYPNLSPKQSSAPGSGNTAAVVYSFLATFQT